MNIQSNSIYEPPDESDDSAQESDVLPKIDDTAAMSLLTETISLVTDSENEVIDVDKETEDVIDESINLPSSDDLAVALDLQRILSRSTLDELSDAFVKGMRNLQIGKDKGSFSQDQKTKTLTGRWFSKDKATAQNGDSEDSSEIIERNTHVTILPSA